MKIKDYEKFRTEVYKYLKQVFFLDADFVEYLKSEYREETIKPENKGDYEVRSMKNTLVLEKYHHEEKTWKRIYDARLYLEIYDDRARFFKANNEKQRFDHVTTIWYEDEPNRTVFLMRLVQKFTEFYYMNQGR